jgi:hypothetical protein
MDEIRHGLVSKRVMLTQRKIISNSFGREYETLVDEIIHDARYDYLGGWILLS